MIMRCIHSSIIALVSLLSPSFATTGTASETITFQVSAALSGHSFKLWQMKNGAAAEITPLTPGYTILDGWQGSEIGYTIAYYELTASFNPDGGTFWLEDTSTVPGSTSPINQVGLANSLWRSTGDTQRQYFAIPESRLGHAIVLVQPQGGTYLVSNGQVQQWVEYDENGLRTLRSYGFAEVSAERDPDNPDFYLIDYTANQQSSLNTSNLASASSWSAWSGSTPAHAVSFTLPLNDSFRRFTLHVLGGATQSLRANESFHMQYGNNPVSDGYCTATGVVGAGMEYWLVRDADGAASPHLRMGLGNQSVDWSSGTLPDIGVVLRDVSSSVAFTVNADTRSIHQFAVYHADGLRIAATSHWYNTTGDEGYIDDYDDAGNALTPFHYGLVRCSVDTGQNWWLVDESVTPPEVFPDRTSNLYDGWAPHHPAFPAGQVGFHINADRFGHDLRISWGNSGTPTTDTWPVTATNADIYDENGNVVGNGPQWGNRDFYDLDGYLLYSASYFVASAPYDGGSGWILKDNSTNEILGSSPGTVAGNFADFANAFVRQSLSLNISATRWWPHVQVLRQPGQPDQAITPGSIQGVWSEDLGNSYFSPYGYFDAITRFVPGLDWWVEDSVDYSNQEPATHQQSDLVSWTAGDATLDSDGDGLPDWYEAIFGTNSSPLDQNGDGVADGYDSDGDGVNDFAEILAHTNPVDAGPRITIFYPANAVLTDF